MEKITKTGFNTVSCIKLPISWKNSTQKYSWEEKKYTLTSNLERAHGGKGVMSSVNIFAFIRHVSFKYNSSTHNSLEHLYENTGYED